MLVFSSMDPAGQLRETSSGEAHQASLPDLAALLAERLERARARFPGVVLDQQEVLARLWPAGAPQGSQAPRDAASLAALYFEDTRSDRAPGQEEILFLPAVEEGRDDVTLKELICVCRAPGWRQQRAMAGSLASRQSPAASLDHGFS